MSRSPDLKQDKQKTIERPFRLSGKGIHSGKVTAISFSPLPENRGICFVKDGSLIPAVAAQVKNTRRGTTLGDIAVVEHLLAACSALGIDNLQIEVDGDEVPTFDGSALPFVDALQKAGIREQKEIKTFLALKVPVEVSDKGAKLLALPYHGFKVDFMVDFAGIGEQRFSFDADKQEFVKEIAPARTFGYTEEYAALKEQGLALGATKENALILDKNGYLSEPRFPDEPVRHKILDLIGDLALLGRPLRAQIKAVKSGHQLNLELVRRLLNQ